MTGRYGERERGGWHAGKGPQVGPEPWVTALLHEAHAPPGEPHVLCLTLSIRIDSNEMRFHRIPQQKSPISWKNTANTACVFTRLCTEPKILIAVALFWPWNAIIKVIWLLSSFRTHHNFPDRSPPSKTKQLFSLLTCAGAVKHGAEIEKAELLMSGRGL